MRHTGQDRDIYVTTGKQAAAFRQEVNCFIKMILPPSECLSPLGIKVYDLTYKCLLYPKPKTHYHVSVVYLFVHWFMYSDGVFYRAVYVWRFVKERWCWGQIISIFVKWKDGQCRIYTSSSGSFSELRIAWWFGRSWFSTRRGQEA